MKALRDSGPSRRASGWCNNIPGESGSSSSRVRAGALTQHEELYISWNSFPNLNIIAKKGLTVRAAVAPQPGLAHCCAGVATRA